MGRPFCSVQPTQPCPRRRATTLARVQNAIDKSEGGKCSHYQCSKHYYLSRNFPAKKRKPSSQRTLRASTLGIDRMPVNSLDITNTPLKPRPGSDTSDSSSDLGSQFELKAKAEPEPGNVWDIETGASTTTQSKSTRTRQTIIDGLKVSRDVLGVISEVSSIFPPLRITLAGLGGVINIALVRMFCGYATNTN